MYLLTYLRPLLNPQEIKTSIRLFFTGFAMGSADIVPGVSGGTVAFILGIYEELIQSIKTMSGEFLRLLLQRKLRKAIQIIPFKFLIPLSLGLFTALLTLAKTISFLLATYPEFLWSFFFGLVLASIFLMRKQVVTWNLHDVIALVVAAVFTYVIVGAVPVETPATPIAMFLSGAIAICAMILPGVSGSFLLVLMGKYEQILTAVVQRDLFTIGVFGLGAIVGLALFSRVLSWLFHRHHDIVIAVLTGFLLGSLRKIWPWKEVITSRINSKGVEVPIVEMNVLPQQIDQFVVISLVLFVIGVGIILLLDRYKVIKEQVEDIEDPKFEKAHKKALKLQEKGKI